MIQKNIIPINSFLLCSVPGGSYYYDYSFCQPWLSGPYHVSATIRMRKVGFPPLILLDINTGGVIDIDNDIVIVNNNNLFCQGDQIWTAILVK